MSALLGVFGAQRAQLPDDRVVRKMLSAMQSRGIERVDTHRESTAFIAVGRSSWETADHIAGPVLIARRGRVVVAADASIYYRQDLRRKLDSAGVRPASNAATDLILAAYQAWGAECAKHLEGDFAFLVLDLEKRAVLAFRDFGGKRPLFWAEVGGALVIASSAGAVLAHPGVSHELNLGCLARDASAMTHSADETTYLHVSRLPAGWGLVRNGDGAVQARRYWEPPEIRTFGRSDPASAEAELRALIGRATLERMAPSGSTVICMSGGRDSTAVFAAGRKALANEAPGRSLDAISVSYLPGDPGREDEYVEAICRHWREPPHWVEIEPLLGNTELFFEAAGRDESNMFPFEPVNRALARETRSHDTRVMLDGNGGDQVFGASPRYVADLLRTGRWLTLAQEWKAEALGGWREFFRMAVRPNLSPAMLRLAKVLRGGKPLATPRDFSRPPVPWLSKTFIREQRMLEFERAVQPPPEGRGVAEFELYWHLIAPNFPNYAARLGSAMLDAGVELRSPLLDERIIRFMTAQPVRERRTKREDKWLLRRCMRGLIPDEVLAYRPTKTGRPVGYMLALIKPLIERMSEAIEQPILAELGVVDAAALQRAARAVVQSTRETGFEVHVYFTLFVEQWLRNHRNGGTNAEYTHVGAGAATA